MRRKFLIVFFILIISVSFASDYEMVDVGSIADMMKDFDSEIIVTVERETEKMKVTLNPGELKCV